MQGIRCIKCGKTLKDNEASCKYCSYQNNLHSGLIDDNTVMSRPGEKRVLDYKKIAKKTVVIIISTAMIGLATAGGVFLYSADEEVKVSMGLMSSTMGVVKKDAKELLRGAKFGMSRDEIISLESKYNDSVKELNNAGYITYNGCSYGGYEGRTTYSFVNNNLQEISVIFYPQDGDTDVYEGLVNTFTKEYGEAIKPEEENSDKLETKWSNGKIAINLQKGEYIKLIVNPFKK